MNSADLQAIIDAAGKATPGPWVQYADTHWVLRLHSGANQGEDLRICGVSLNTHYDQSRHNTAHIANCDPDTVAQLARIALAAETLYRKPGHWETWIEFENALRDAGLIE